MNDPSIFLFANEPLLGSGTGHYHKGRIIRHGCAPPPTAHPLTDEQQGRWPELPLWEDGHSMLATIHDSGVTSSPVVRERLFNAYGLHGEEAVVAYVFGGKDLSDRTVKGILASATPKPDVPLADQKETKRSMGQRILAFLSSDLLYPETTPVAGQENGVVFLFASQTLGSQQRCGTVFYRSVAGVVYMTTPSGVVEVDVAKLRHNLEILLVSSYGDIARSDVAAAYLNIFNVNVDTMLDTNFIVANAVQAQSKLRLEQATRRLWELLEMRGGIQSPEILRSPVVRHLVGESFHLSLDSDPSSFKGITKESLRSAVSTADKDTLSSMYQTSAFSLQSYARMRDDLDRTNGYKRAIYETCKGKTVLEIGTGPFALLSIFALEAGAQHVYAIEADETAFLKAQQTVKTLPEPLQEKITLILGISTDVNLPNNAKADVVIHELIGVLTTEEGVIETLRDCAQRFLSPKFVSIPFRVKTEAAFFKGDDVIEDVKHSADTKKCGCCGGGWCLGIGLEHRTQRSEVFCIENVPFAPGALLENSNNTCQVPFTLNEATNNLGLWVDLQLLETDTPSQHISSLKDSSCWPKCLIRFDAHIDPGQHTLDFTSESTHPMRYTFKVLSQKASPVIIYNTPPTKLDEWLAGAREGVLLNDILKDTPLGEETRLVSINGVALEGNTGKRQLERALQGSAPLDCVVKRCRLENLLSPLHHSILTADMQKWTPEQYRVRDGLWGLTGAHLMALLHHNTPETASLCETVDLQDSYLHGTPKEWYNLLTPYYHRTEKVCYFDVEKGSVQSGDVFKEEYGRTLIASDVVRMSFVVEVLLRIKVSANEELLREVREEDEVRRVGLKGLSLVALRAFKPGDFVCSMLGEVKPMSGFGGLAEPRPDTTNVTRFPSEHIPYYLDTAACANPGSFLQKRTIDETASCKKTLIPHGGTLRLVAVADMHIKQGDVLSVFE